jgi:ribosome-associated protein
MQRAHVRVSDDALTWRFVTSGGPGGQNVNKVATAVELRVNLDRADLPSPVRARLETLAGRRLTKDGEIVIFAQRFRSQARNREDALARLDALVEAASRTEKPRVATKPTFASKQRRKATKSKRGQTKRLRGRPGPED